MKRIRDLSMLLVCALTIAMMLGMTASAAPKVMPDGGVFDAEYYAQKNPDVVGAVGSDESVLYQHYLNNGKAEGRAAYDPADAATVNKLLNTETEKQLGKSTAKASKKGSAKVTEKAKSGTKTSGKSAGKTTAAKSGQAAKAQTSSSGNAGGQEYVLNTSTMKFHLPGCSSVDKMSKANKQVVNDSRDHILSLGYSPCKRCNP